MKAQRITNPLWLGSIADRIQKLVKRVEIATIDYETLYTYFVNSIQFGGEGSEFVVVFDDDKPVAFGHWMVRPLPHRGAVFCDYFYNWGKKDAVDILIDSLIQFAVKHRSPWITGQFVNEAAFRLFHKRGKTHGLKIDQTPRVTFIARKENESHN